jgi:hypothetical protein
VFFPYTPYLDSANHFCSELERKEYVGWYDLLASVTLTALSVEALVNTIGELVVHDFKDFESSSPAAKLRVICQTMGLEFNRTKKPFAEVMNLLRIRNRLAHPKYKHLRYESPEMPIEEARRHYHEVGEVLHDIEKSLSPDIARKSLDAVVDLAQMLRATLKHEVFQSSSKRLVIDGVDVFQGKPGQVDAQAS